MIDLYGQLLRRVLLPAWEGGVRRRPTMARLRDLEQSQWLSRDELVAMQSRALATLLRHAYDHVPFYRARFDAAGLTPADIAGPDDLAKLPILQRDDARDTSEERTASAPPYATVYKNTSGTMGRPLSFAYNQESETRRQAMKMRGYSWAGYPPGARSLHYWGVSTGPPPPFLRRSKISLDRALKRELYLDCTHRGDNHLREVVEEIRKTNPDVILTYSQSGGDLARYVNRTGCRAWGTIPIICGAERVFDADRDAMEQAFGPAVFETYGCREFMLIATECEAHDGLHVSMEGLIVELVVRDEGVERPANPGEVGEVVVTDLYNLAMPFIRYVNGDLATSRAPEPCKCGRHLDRIGPIEGRITETLRDGEGNPVSGLVFNLLFCDLAEAAQRFQAVQHLDGNITLKIVPDGTMSEEAQAQLKRHCAKYLPGVDVRTQLVEDIPATSTGKRQVVVVERPAAG